MSSKLIKDLNSVANIVGGLGLSVAAAQRALNLDYLESLERLAAIAISLQHPTGDAGGAGAALGDEDRKFVQDFISKFAPSRYQYTKTTLNVRLDLAQTVNAGGSAGLGIGVGALAVNASFAFSYGSEYQAAAECQTVLDAISPQLDATMIQRLSEQAATSAATKLTVPARATVDTEIIKASQGIIEKLYNKKPTPIEEKSEEK